VPILYPISSQLSRKKFSRRKSFELYKQVIQLRKKEYSYSEICRETGLAKSTINNWLTYAGLTLSKEHMEIRRKNGLRNHVIATEASKRTRLRRKQKEIQDFLNSHKQHFGDPFFSYGLSLFEAEGCKETECRFSNSDFRLILTFVRFIEKYFSLERTKNMSFNMYIHKSRRQDLGRIKGFWSKKIGIPAKKIKVYWKKNQIVRRRHNPDYVGQILVGVHGENILGSKLLALSDIILKKYQRL
jgi:transposase-like protein